MFDQELTVDERPDDEVSLSKLKLTDSGGPVIAVDLDDVLCQTNSAVAHCKLSSALFYHSSLLTSCPLAGHNERFGTDLDISKFYCKQYHSFLDLASILHCNLFLKDYYYWKAMSRV